MGGGRGGAALTDEVKLERGLELWVSDVRLFESERRWPDEALELGRLPSEGLADKGDLGGRGAVRVKDA
jgi:hypothetical protein